MEPLNLILPGGNAVTGIQNNPTSSQVTTPRSRPLIVAFHGGSYECHYFDADAQHTAKIPSDTYGIPFISLDRLDYGGTSSVLPVPEGSSFPIEEGKRMHEHIFPTIWTQHGIPNGCSCLIVLCHSLGSMAGIVAAALHSQEDKPSYPLGGLIFSGLADKHQSGIDSPFPEPNVGSYHFRYLVQGKDSMMFRPGTVDPSILDQSERLNAPIPLPEMKSLYEYWIHNWKQDWAHRVRVPVMYALPGQDCFFESTTENARQTMAAFTNSPRVEGGLILGAPHCMELSHWSQGWYARCFGFALECAACAALSAQGQGQS
ncbi:hypothetical protein KC331_g8834 [Hortaea werneckii]|uniref:AB hydrolase-1 domain-containing protein n=1 Tax=Hortaea werneckii TaxID=91943 RepID=A0A3M7CM31_HORWE|nr:hypothetical protein KC331_g8834 [Hortaea werneckii]KAI7713294.1 hypothetical protein KC353_g7671 [Hortaea werneckii]RMY52696.1 hypothetical protein D0865_05650 [Hortaea werneckii]